MSHDPNVVDDHCEYCGESEPECLCREFADGSVELSTKDFQALDGFVKQVAALTRDRECPNCREDCEFPNEACTDHIEFDMESDDAVETVNSLITRAREILKGGGAK